MGKENNQQPQNLNVEISADVAKGTYSNLAIISHTAAEIVLDFAQVLPGTKSCLVRDRVIMSPIHAKRLLAALNDNIQRFENQFGTINEPAVRQLGDTVPYDIIGKA
ncbi:MAG: DUF3467 domain-containing protein [Bacteroidales bacterium]|nr:DUF3467 domain-containing protein [Bacteroidales bacterium]